MQNNEIWKPIVNYERYLISNFGRVRSIKGKNITLLNTSEDKDGYLKIRLTYGVRKRIKKSLHRLVAIAFIPNPNNYPTVNHIDGNKKNNSVNNLEWSSYSQNNQHAYDTGLKKRYGQHYNARKIAIYNVNTNAIYQYDCIINAINIFHISERSIYRYLDVNRLYKQKYKIYSIANLNEQHYINYQEQSSTTSRM